jgi:hypothetical protein
MGKTIKSTLSAALFLTVLSVFIFTGEALANLPTSGKTGGKNKKPTDSTKVSYTIPEKEWVIVELTTDTTSSNQPAVINIEKKNISQVPVTRIEVRNCKQNNFPPELAPLMNQISQSPNGRKVYKSEENGKTIYYISPVQDEQQTEQQTNEEVDPSSLTFPLFWNMKI